MDSPVEIELELAFRNGHAARQGRPLLGSVAQLG